MRNDIRFDKSRPTVAMVNRDVGSVLSSRLINMPPLRGRPEISVTTSTGRPDGVVPFAVELCRAKIHRRHLVVGDFKSGRVAVFVQGGSDSETGFGGRFCDQLNDDFVAGQRLASPVDTDLTEQTMFNLFPFA